MSCEQNITIEPEGGEQMINLQAENGEQPVRVQPEALRATEVTSYNRLSDKPSINDVELVGNKTFEELGVETMSNLKIKEIFNRVFEGGN